MLESESVPVSICTVPALLFMRELQGEDLYGSHVWTHGAAEQFIVLKRHRQRRSPLKPEEVSQISESMAGWTPAELMFVRTLHLQTLFSTAALLQIIKSPLQVYHVY